ncbi:MAG: SUF system Fe-S cluster assembly protein [Bacteroidetes bacterium]|nr:SUF system Fe-S cluster assembly protein [Bacteroidota bacterium]
MTEKEILKETITKVMKSVYDPEIPVDIWELGLIYEINIDDEANVQIIMTLTAPNCPVAESMPNEVKEKVQNVKGVKSVKLDLVFDPPWDKDKMSEEAKLMLGFL